jgi:putative membrane protein
MDRSRSCHAISRLFSIDHQTTGRPWLKILFYGVFILPILTGFTFPQKFLDSAVAENRGVQLNFNSTLTPVSKETEKTPDSTNVQPANTSLSTDTKAPEKTVDTKNVNPVDASPQSAVQPVQQQTKKSPEEVFKEASFGQSTADTALALYKQNLIRIPDDNYVEDLTAINLYLDQFIGKKMELTGFIHRTEHMKKDETVVARFAVACCTADATVFGLDVKGSMVNNYTKDTWVKVQGTIDQMELDGMMVPMLHVEKIEKVKAAKDPYVY